MGFAQHAQRGSRLSPFQIDPSHPSAASFRRPLASSRVSATSTEIPSVMCCESMGDRDPDPDKDARQDAPRYVILGPRIAPVAQTPLRPQTSWALELEYEDSGRDGDAHR